ncbi:hypothetical protein U9M48_000373 [Paspalum notatum var. saurae]|uniref:Uncharacterized protein n=1 Tax=Paspalum notatum var. saurae TaxID=547442 RepID=A0AAQ3PK57_PASNO
MHVAVAGHVNAGTVRVQAPGRWLYHIPVDAYLVQVPHTNSSTKLATPKRAPAACASSMADLVMGGMPRLIPKLAELLKEEYNLQTGVKERVRSLAVVLEHSQAALLKVAQVPWDELDGQVKLWAREVRESSYDMEDILDIFLVHVQGSGSAGPKRLLKGLGEKMANLFKKSKARRDITVGVKDIMAHLDEVTERCRRYKVHDIVAKPATTSTVDPRLAAMYNKVKDLVGIDKPSVELMSLLQNQQQGDVPNAKTKVVSIVGVGGLGKTTLAKAVYDKIKGDYDCGAFVPIGRNPDLKKVFKDVLIDLDKKKYLEFSTAVLDERQLINEIRSFFLENTTPPALPLFKISGVLLYFIVIDDLWEIQSWKTIKLAIDDDNSCGGNHVDNQPDEISDEILKKCGGIPLAIVTISSLLVGKPRDNWSEIYKSIGFGYKYDKEVENTIMRILSFSYYDLPSHLRSCLLYLAAFPEDSVIRKNSLVWKWVAEGFVHEEHGRRLFEIGEGYFNDLINRSLIQAVESNILGSIFNCLIEDMKMGAAQMASCIINPSTKRTTIEARESDSCDSIIGCRVHDMVLDFIRSMLHQENFFTGLGNDQGTVFHSSVRRLAHHNMTIGNTYRANHFEDTPKVRSFIVQGCGIERRVSISSFTLLRVLAIENCFATGGDAIHVKHLGHLVHLRGKKIFLGSKQALSLRQTHVDEIPEEIGGLRFLQTLDMWGSHIVEAPSSKSFPTKLVCLRVTFGEVSGNANMASLERLTFLEELSIVVAWEDRDG